MYCIFSLAVLAAVASASPIYLTELPSTSFIKNDNYMDYLKAAAFEKPIFLATRSAGNVDDLTATLIDGGYRSLSMMPRYRQLRDNLLSGEKMVFLLKPASRASSSVLPVRHFVLPEHLSTIRSSEFAESMHAHPWIVLLDHSDLKSDLYGRLMREHAVDVTDDSVALIKSALVGYKPAHLIAGVHSIEPAVHRALPLRIASSRHFAPYALKSFANYRTVPVPIPTSAQRSIAVPYVIPAAASEFDFEPAQRVEAIPVPVPYTIPQDSYVVQPSASASALLNSARLQADERSARPTFYIVLNNDLTHAKRISEDEAIRLLTHGKMFADLEKSASSSSSSSVAAEASGALSSESSAASKSGSSSLNSGKKTITKTVETVTTTDNAGGILESAVNTGANLVSAGAQAIKTGASEISKSAENLSSFLSSSASEALSAAGQAATSAASSEASSAHRSKRYLPSPFLPATWLPALIDNIHKQVGR